MPTLRDIKRRIKAVRNTRQITKAMKMVAASKLRRAQDRMLQLRPYSDKIDSIIKDLSGEVSEEMHPLFASRPRKNVEVLVVTSDRGLCGAFNTNILKTAQAFVAGKKKEGFEVGLSVIGKKAVDYFKRRGFSMRMRWTGLSGKPSYGSAQKVAVDIMENFLNETFDEVFVVYNEFKSMAKQSVTVARLLPLSPLEGAAEGAAVEPRDFIYEPSKKAILETLLPKNVEIQVFRAVLESQTSEEAARMAAMENATKSASEMIDNLTLVANKVRQATITKELMDIVGGVEALK